MANKIKTGTIFKDVYNNNFYQVVGATNKTVTVKEIKTECIDVVNVYTAHSYETAHMPIKDGFFNRPQKRCTVKPSCPARPNQPYIISPTGWAIPWDGKSHIVDHYS